MAVLALLLALGGPSALLLPQEGPSPMVRRQAITRTLVAAPLTFILASPRAESASLSEPEVRGLDKENTVVKTFTELANGVRYADLKLGSGAEAAPGDTLVCQWVLRRADGYFVDSSEKHSFAPVRLAVGRSELPGLDDALLGVRAGGVRRILVPVSKAGGADQIGTKLGLEFGPRRQLERQFKRQDPYNILFYELSVDKVQKR